MIRLAMLSFWHVHAGGYAERANEHPGTELVACWDEEPARGREYAEKLQIPFHADLDEILARPDVDGVIVDAPTDRHLEVLTKAANAGKHIFTEKVLALTERECDQILDAVDKAGVLLVVSLPRLYEGYALAIDHAIAGGEVGDVTLVRTRLSHSGALPEPWLPARFFDLQQCGGGALVDLGCHPMYLARQFLGSLPTTVSASYGHVTGRAVEDNAVAVLRYENGALGIVEAGFVNKHSPFVIEVHGTEGSVLYSDHDKRLMINGRSTEGWTELDVPSNGRAPFEQFVDHITAGTRSPANVAAAVDLTRLMEAANHSVAVDAPVRIEVSP